MSLGKLSRTRKLQKYQLKISKFLNWLNKPAQDRELFLQLFIIIGGIFVSILLIGSLIYLLLSS